MINPLIISPFFYRQNNANGLVDRSLFQNLPKDYKPSILTTNTFDKKLLEEDLCNKIIVKERKTIQYLYKYLKHTPFREFALLPDIYHFSWQGNVEKKIKDLSLDKYSYIHSTSVPYTDHIIAYNIKKRYGIPWIAQFYEPWIDNNYRPLKHKYFIDKNIKLERIVAENADMIIHDSIDMCNLWKSRYGVEIAKKIVFLPMPFDVSKCIKVNSDKNESGKITITHIGTFYHKRNSVNFIEGLSLFLSKEPTKRNDLEIVFVGTVTKEDYCIIKEKGFEDIVKIVGKVPESECIKYYNESDIFLAVDGDNNDNLFYPSKVLKYYYYQKPILGLVNPGSVLSSELKKAGYTSILKKDYISISNFLSTATSNYHSLLKFDHNYWKFFTDSYVVKKYDTYVKEIVLNQKR